MASAVLQRLFRVLGQELCGLYLSGSVAVGDYLPGSSDIDLFAVVAGSSSDQKKRDVAHALLHPALDIPARGLEFVLYERARVEAPSRNGDFVLNLNVGPDMPVHVSFAPDEEPAHWFVLDRAIVREHGIAVFGPEPSSLFAEIPRPVLLQALRDSIGWHETHDEMGFNAVLNSCRALRFTRQGVWSSKAGAARWAIEEGEDPVLIEAALRLRRKEDAGLDPQSVQRFLSRVRDETERTLA